MSGPEGAMPPQTIDFLNQALVGLGREVASTVHVPMTGPGQLPPADEGLFTFTKPAPPEAPCDLPDDLYDPRHRMVIEGAGVDSSIAIAEPNESGPAVPGNNYVVDVDPHTLASIAALYRGEKPGSEA